MVLLLHAAPNGSVPSVLAEGWSFSVRPAIGLWLAYTVGLVAATGICLPSFYFYGLLAGVRISFLQVVTHCLKGQASTAIMLIGILPIYVAVALGMLIFAAPVELQQMVLSIGLVPALWRGVMGSLLDLPRFHALGRHLAGPLPRPPNVLSAKANGGLGRLLHCGDAAHDPRAVDAFHGLIAFRARSFRHGPAQFEFRVVLDDRRRRGPGGLSCRPGWHADGAVHSGGDSRAIWPLMCRLLRGTGPAWCPRNLSQLTTTPSTST